ncbi:hypothetical protein RUM43_012020, partial [Polyplax serrata]
MADKILEHSLMSSIAQISQPLSNDLSTHLDALERQIASLIVARSRTAHLTRYVGEARPEKDSEVVLDASFVFIMPNSETRMKIGFFSIYKSRQLPVEQVPLPGFPVAIFAALKEQKCRDRQNLQENSL